MWSWKPHRTQIMTFNRSNMSRYLNRDMETTFVNNVKNSQYARVWALHFIRLIKYPEVKFRIYRTYSLGIQITKNTKKPIMETFDDKQSKILKQKFFFFFFSQESCYMTQAKGKSKVPHRSRCKSEASMGNSTGLFQRFYQRGNFENMPQTSLMCGKRRNYAANAAKQ